MISSEEGMGESKRKKAQAAISSGRDDVALSKQMTLPQRVLDDAVKGLDGFWRYVDTLRQDPTHIVGATGPWNTWCYVPVNSVVGIAAHMVRDRMTPSEVEQRWVHKTRLLSAVSAWRMTKGVYVFDPVVVKAITESEVEEELPDEMFLQLPDWCPYISTPGMQIMEGVVIHGFFAYVDDRTYGNRRHYPPELNFEILVDPSLTDDEGLGPVAMGNGDIQSKIFSELKDGAITTGQVLDRACQLARAGEYLHVHMNVPLGQGKFSKAFAEQTENNAKAYPDSLPGQALEHLKQVDGSKGPLTDVMKLFGMMQARLGALLLYLVSDKPDISPDPDQGEARNRIVLNEKRGIRNFQASKIKPWEVGFRIGAEIRAYEERSNDPAVEYGSGLFMRPHVRRAHWHTFWTGPRNQPELRQKRVRWLPPTPVNVRTSDDLIPTMHKVVK
jgi:hypothetical protein